MAFQCQPGWIVSGNVLTATFANVPLLEPSAYGTSPTVQMAPGPHTVMAEFGGVDTTHLPVEVNADRDDEFVYHLVVVPCHVLSTRFSRMMSVPHLGFSRWR